MKYCIPFVLSLLLASHAGAAPVDWARVHDMTMRGIHHLYDLEIDQAINVFDSVSALAPQDPRGAFFQSMVQFYLYGLNRNEETLTKFLDESERVIGICEHLLDQNENDARTKFYLGGIHGYRGLAYQTSGSMLKAAEEGRRGYLLLEEAVREDPRLYDAQMGFGLFKYLLAKLPKSMRWILSVLGFSGDLEGGLHALKLAAVKGTYTRTEAKLFLAQFMFSEGRRDTALQYITELRQEYPGNTLFMVLYAFWQHRLGHLDEAMAAASKAMEINARRNIRYGEELAYSTLGSICFSKNDFVNAGKYYRLYRDAGHADDRIPNWTYYRAGVACEIAGDRATALDFYRRVQEKGNPDRAWDVFYYRRAQELARRPLTEAEILIVKGENQLSQKKYPDALAMFHDALGRTGVSADAQARALYGVQQAEFESDSLAPALETSRRLLAVKPVSETWILPHGWFRLGQIYARMGKTQEALDALDRAERYDDYDFQDRLESRISDERKKLNQS